MRLQREISTAAPASSVDEQAAACCLQSIAAEERGDYLAAFAALAPFCEKIGDEPRLEGLNDFSRATVLLRAGVLTSRIGTHKGLKHTQEQAKNLLSASRDYFAKVSFRDGIAEALTYLAACYLMLGEMAEARITLHDALTHVSEFTGNAVSIKAHIWLAIIEYGSKRYGDALHLLEQTKAHLTGISSHYLLGTFYSEYGKNLEAAGNAEGKAEYLDQALIELSAAAYHFEQAQHERFQARVENNLGLLFNNLKKYSDALIHFDNSRRIFARLKDASIVARIDVNRARSYRELERYIDALRIIKQAVNTLEHGEEAARLVEAYIEQGTILAKAGNTTQARSVFSRAVLRANEAGNREAAGLAYLTLLEEVSDLTDAESVSAYQEARTLLDEVQDISITRRLLRMSGRVLDSMSRKTSLPVNGESRGNELDEGFSLARAKRELERDLIIKAMAKAGGNASEAARMLGFSKPQRLHQLLEEHGLEKLKNRRHHKHLVEVAAPAVVLDLCTYIEFELPSGVSAGDVCTIHRFKRDFLPATGARTGDYAIVLKGAVEVGDLVGVDIYGDAYFIGVLTHDGEYIEITPVNEAIRPQRLRSDSVKVEGRVVGYLREVDVRDFRKGSPVKSYSI